MGAGSSRQRADSDDGCNEYGKPLITEKALLASLSEVFILTAIQQNIPQELQDLVPRMDSRDIRKAKYINYAIEKVASNEIFKILLENGHGDALNDETTRQVVEDAVAAINDDKERGRIQKFLFQKFLFQKPIKSANKC